MRTSRKLTHYLMAVFAVAMMSMAALAADPGMALPASSEASDQKAGSLLVYTLYQSDASNVAARDTKINITNTNDSNPIIVHFFFVARDCSVADFKTELTANQTYSFLTSDFDPGTDGYILAVAENYLGIPIRFNYLIGDLFTKNVLSASNSYQANLGAIAFAAMWNDAADPRTTNVTNGQRQSGSQIPTRTVVSGSSSLTRTEASYANAVTLFASLDGVDYNRVPVTLALSNIPSRASNDRTILVLLSPRGNLLTGMSTPGTAFGLLFDDAEQSQSFQLGLSSCINTITLDNNNPRTVPRFESVIPAGRTGWMKVYNTSQLGMLGSMIVYDQQARVDFEGGHNLHHLTLMQDGDSRTLSNSLTFPIFPFTGN